MDIKTLVFALAVGNLSLCAALFFFEFESRRSLSLSVWSVAKQCQAAAWILVFLRGVVPDFMSIALANALLFAGIALDAGALWQAAGRGNCAGRGFDRRGFFEVDTGKKPDWTQTLSN